MNQSQQQALATLNCSVQGQSIAGLTSSPNNTQNLLYTANGTGSLTGITTSTTGGTYTYAYNDTSANTTLWGYWQNQYYPYIIRESYPIYIQEKAMDKGKQAFEILKTLQDKKLIEFKKVADFIEGMDAVLKVL